METTFQGPVKVFLDVLNGLPGMDKGRAWAAFYHGETTSIELYRGGGQVATNSYDEAQSAGMPCAKAVCYRWLKRIVDDVPMSGNEFSDKEDVSTDMAVDRALIGAMEEFSKTGMVRRRGEPPPPHKT